MFAFGVVEHVRLHGAVGKIVGLFLAGRGVVGIEFQVGGLVGLIYGPVDFGEIEEVTGSIAATELALAGIEPDPLLEGAVEDLDDGVAASDEDFEIVAGFVGGGVAVSMAHAHEARGDIEAVERMAEHFAEIGAPAMIDFGENALVLAEGMKVIHLIRRSAAL